MWRKSSNWTKLYRLLAVKDETCRVQFPSGPISFRSTFIKPYFRSKNTHNVKLDELEVLTKLDELETPAKLNKLKVPLPTLEVPQKPTKTTKPAVKCGRGRPRKNPVIKNYLTFVGIPARQSPPADILVLV